MLWHARRAAGLTLDFVSGRTFEDYEQDSMLKSAVKRQFQVIGEALNRLSRVDLATADRGLSTLDRDPSVRRVCDVKDP